MKHETDHKIEAAYENVDPETMIIRDHLAFDRTVLANERTILSYLRTAITLVITGMVLIKFYTGPNDVLALPTAIALIVMAICLAVFGTYRYAKVQLRISRVYKTRKADARPGRSESQSIPG